MESLHVVLWLVVWDPVVEWGSLRPQVVLALQMEWTRALELALETKPTQVLESAPVAQVVCG